MHSYVTSARFTTGSVVFFVLLGMPIPPSTCLAQVAEPARKGGPAAVQGVAHQLHREIGVRDSRGPQVVRQRSVRSKVRVGVQLEDERLVVTLANPEINTRVIPRSQQTKCLL